MPRSGRPDRRGSGGDRERITITTARPGNVRVSITAGLFGVDPVVPRHARWAFQRPAGEGRSDSVLTIETSDGGPASSSSSETSDEAGSLDVGTSGSGGEAASTAAAKGDASKAKKGKGSGSCLKCEKEVGDGCMKKKKARDAMGHREKQDRNTKDKATACKNQKKKKADKPHKKEKDAPTRKDAGDTSAAESSEAPSKKIAKKHKKKKANKPASPTKPDDTEQSAAETTDAGDASANATSGAEETEGGQAGGGGDPKEPSAQDRTGKDTSTATHRNGDKSTNRAADTEATKEAAKNSDDAGWTDSQDAIILSMKDGNETWAIIGRAVGRGKKEVQKRHKELLATRGAGAGTSTAAPGEAAHDEADNNGRNKKAEAAQERDERSKDRDGDRKKQKKKAKATKDKSAPGDTDDTSDLRSPHGTTPYSYLSEQDPRSDRRIYGDHFPSNSLVQNVQPDANFNERDCQVLVRLADENSRNKWLEMQAAFFNYTGRMVSIELLKHKIGRYVDGESEERDTQG